VDPERYERLSKLFRDACDLEPHERDGFLDRACASDPTLREELESLLTHDETATAADLGTTPEHVGPYRLLEKIGEGGMGEVWLAEQEQPVRRRVALKLIKIGMDTRQVVARFEAERQALALMEHPAIAKVFDAGVSRQGRPYFAMEYVKGESITTYCDRNRLTTDERLELFMQVCEGVQHAHQKGVIHRDIKPSNVLVQIQDDKPAPKIIDFGVAKATQQRLTEKTVYTQRGMLIGTPEYMSPEQAEMTGLDVDTRSDVYSLGVLLYELLVGALPFDSRELREAGFDEIRRKIREEEPSKPSTRISTLGGSSQSSAQNRGTDPRSLSRELRGDLDWITMKALEKDRTRRYGSPSELAAELRRHLNYEPVLASPPNAAYRLRRFVSRHRVGVTAAGLVFVTLIAGIVGTTTGLIRARQAERVALDESRTARSVTEFLLETFRGANPFGEPREGEALGETITARQILDHGTAKARRELDDAPLIKAELLDSIGLIYLELGLLDSAEPLLDEALRIRTRQLGERNAETALTVTHVAKLRLSQSRYREAEDLAVSALDLQTSLLGPDHFDLAETTAVLGLTRISLSRLDEAEIPIRQGLEILETSLGPDHPKVAEQLQLLARLVTYQGNLAEAERLAKRALKIFEDTLGPDHPRILSAIAKLTDIYTGQRRLDEAKVLSERARKIREQVLGPDHPETIRGASSLGLTYVQEGRAEEGMELIEEVLAKLERLYGPDHGSVGWVLYKLTFAHINLKDFAAAEQSARRALQIDQKSGSNNYVYWYTLAYVLNGQGKLDEAEEYYEQAVALGEQQRNADYPFMTGVLRGFAELRHKQERFDEAETLVVRAREIAEKAYGPQHGDFALALATHAQILRAQEQYDDALRLLHRSIAILEATGEKRGVKSVAWQLGRLQSEAGRHEQAMETMEIVARILGAEDPETLNFQYYLAKRYVLADRYDLAEPVLADLREIQRRLPDEVEGNRRRATVMHAVSAQQVGKLELAGQLARELLETSTVSADDLYNVACVLARLGKRDDALVALGRSADEGLVGPISDDPDLASLRGAPEFEAILRRLGG